MILSRHGLREMLLLTAVLGILGAAAAMLHWVAGVAVGLVWLCGLAFFRDPQRRIPGDRGLLVAPADGRVTEVSQLEHHEHVGGPATRIGIFLSVFDVHINRSPCAGRVLRTIYAPGEFLDARHPESGRRNESNTILLQPESDLPAPIVVRQVAGLIARRIVCAIGPEQNVTRGQRIGMIKFGSRTELIVPRDQRWQPQVRVGDRVAGGSSVLLRYEAPKPTDEKPHEARTNTPVAQAAAR